MQTKFLFSCPWIIEAWLLRNDRSMIIIDREWVIIRSRWTRLSPCLRLVKQERKKKEKKRDHSSMKVSTCLDFSIVFNRLTIIFLHRQCNDFLTTINRGGRSQNRFSSLHDRLSRPNEPQRIISSARRFFPSTVKSHAQKTLFHWCILVLVILNFSLHIYSFSIVLSSFSLIIIDSKRFVIIISFVLDSMQTTNLPRSKTFFDGDSRNARLSDRCRH